MHCFLVCLYLRLLFIYSLPLPNNNLNLNEHKSLYGTQTITVGRGGCACGAQKVITRWLKRGQCAVVMSVLFCCAWSRPVRPFHL